MPKKKKQQQEMEKQLLALAASPAISTLIAVGGAIYAIPYAMKYLVRNAEMQGLPYVAMLPERIGNAISDHAKATREALDEEKKEEWHEANPDVTTLDIDVPAKSGDPYTDYLNQVGLPLSSVLLIVGDDEALAAYRSPVLGAFSSWRYYGIRRINNQNYWLLIPKGISVTYEITKDVFVPPDNGKCPIGTTTITKDAQGFPLPGGVVRCKKIITELKVLEPIMVWPVYGLTL